MSCLEQTFEMKSKLIKVKKRASKDEQCWIKDGEVDKKKNENHNDDDNDDDDGNDVDGGERKARNEHHWSSM